jgi:hypothetical protein
VKNLSTKIIILSKNTNASVLLLKKKPLRDGVALKK